MTTASAFQNQDDVVVHRLVRSTVRIAERLQNIRDNFPLTEEQRLMKMDPFLVYLATLCCSCHASNKLNETSIDMLRRKRFAALQQLIIAVKDDQQGPPPSLFAWSPRLSSPTQDQLQRVKKDLEDVKKQMENEAMKVVEELRLEAENDKAKLSKQNGDSGKPKKKKTKRPVQASKKVETQEITDSNSNNDKSEDTISLQELLQQRLGNSNENVDSTNNEDWVPVVKKSNIKSRAEPVKKYVTPVSTAQALHQESYAVDGARQTFTDATSEHDDEDIFSDAIDNPTVDVASLVSVESSPSGMSRKEPPASHQEREASITTLGSDNADTHEKEQHEQTTEAPRLRPACQSSTKDSPQPHLQQQRIRELEQQLSALQQEHAKTLQNQREHYDDLIQSLQLRLYISETKLKTYGQALEEHIQAVQANVAPSSPHRTRQRSMSGVVDDFNEDAPLQASSPTLIAKALQKNSNSVNQGSEAATTATPHRRGKSTSKPAILATTLFAMMLCFTIALSSLATTVSAVKSFPTIGSKTRKVKQTCWTEEDGLETDFALSSKRNKYDRKQLMFGRYEAIDPFGAMSLRESARRRSDNKPEHPLRTDRWQFDICWTRKADRSPDADKRESLHVELHPDGYVRASAINITAPNRNTDAPVVAIGRWTKQPWGVRIVVRPLMIASIADSVDNPSRILPQQQKLHISQDYEWIMFSPAFHPNPFGKYPKLTQGTIIQQKPVAWTYDDQEDEALAKRLLRGGLQLKQMFRPVVGTFSARGSDRKQ